MKKIGDKKYAKKMKARSNTLYLQDLEKRRESEMIKHAERVFNRRTTRLKVI